MKSLLVQKRLAGEVLKCSPKRVVFDPEALEQIKEAITKVDIRALVSGGAIVKKQKKGVSRARAKALAEKKKKGQRIGHGSRKGKNTARTPKKEAWMKKVRTQRDFLKELKEKGLVSTKVYQDLYRKSKGGYFRSKRHIKLFMNEHNLVTAKE